MVSLTWSEAVLAGIAAGIGSAYLTLLAQRAGQPPRYDALPYPFPASFLQNEHTISPPEEQVATTNRGWSMQDAMQEAKEQGEKVKAKDPADVLKSLQRGNSRFWTGQARRPEKSAFERRALIKHQFPTTAVLGCSDSRVPVEIVFDQGLGDMFVVRVAGNCLGVTTQASIDYAVHHLNVKVLLIMGHEGCGAIKAAGLPPDQIQGETKALATVLTDLKEGLKDLPPVMDPRARDREAVAANVRRQITALTKDERIMEKVNEGKLIIIGAFYEISSGIADFFMQVSKKLSADDRKPSPGVLSRYHPDTEEIVSAT